MYSRFLRTSFSGYPRWNCFSTPGFQGINSVSHAPTTRPPTPFDTTEDHSPAAWKNSTFPKSLRRWRNLWIRRSLWKGCESKIVIFGCEIKGTNDKSVWSVFFKQEWRNSLKVKTIQQCFKKKKYHSRTISQNPSWQWWNKNASRWSQKTNWFLPPSFIKSNAAGIPATSSQVHVGHVLGYYPLSVDHQDSDICL